MTMKKKEETLEEMCKRVENAPLDSTPCKYATSGIIQTVYK